MIVFNHYDSQLKGFKTLSYSIPLKILGLFLAILPTFSSQATNQIPDKLIFQDKTLAIHHFPLEKRFDSSKKLKEKLAAARGNQIPSTANHRGYIASFKILDNQLVISDIELEQQFREGKLLKPVSIIEKIFPKPKDRYMNWYSGILTGGIDETGGTFHLPNIHRTSYKSYLVFKVVKGQVIEMAELNESQFRDYDKRLLERYMKTSEYQVLRKNQLKNDNKSSRYLLSAEILQQSTYTQQMDVPFIHKDKSSNLKSKQ
jgi:hypothetical protein